jgi:hypothetical protein
MLYGFLADLIVVVHLAYVAFVVVGQAAILVGVLAGWRFARNFWFRLFHLLAIGIVAMEAASSVMCPLTLWEQDLRKLAGQEVSDASFVGRLVHDVFIFPVPADAFDLCYFAFGSVVLLTLVLLPPRLPRFPRRDPTPEPQSTTRSPALVGGPH